MSLQFSDLSLLPGALATLNAGFADLGVAPPARLVDNPVDHAAIDAVLQATAEKLQDNYPYHHPNYAGQMLKPPHPVARLAYALAQWINPNNHALDGGRASSSMEKAAVAHIAAMFGWQEQHLGHLCSGGTVANLEALWVARETSAVDRETVAASACSHYTHSRLSTVLRTPYVTLPVDDRARIDVDALEQSLARGAIGTVVVTLGTTGYGSVDPLADIVQLQARYPFRIHVDAAYGGYYALLGDLPAAAHMRAANQADSIVIDPHKHGLQPYGCGCILLRDPNEGRVYAHDSPYTYFTSSELHLGEISLECSRAGASAVALWATQQLLPSVAGGEFAAGLGASRAAALAFYEYLEGESGWLPLFEPELDIVVWAPRAASTSQCSARSRAIFDALAQQNIHLALVNVAPQFLGPEFAGVQRDTDDVVCLRTCLMKPEHRDWLPQLQHALDEHLQ